MSSSTATFPELTGKNLPGERSYGNIWAGQVESKLPVSRYDRVSAFMAALILLTAFLVAVLAIIWASMSPEQRSRFRIIPVPPPVTPDDGDDSKLDSSELSDPAAGLPGAGIEADFSTTLSFVRQAVVNTRGEGNGLDGTGIGGPLPKRIPGPTPVNAKPLQWQLHFSAADIDEYASQLDSLQIALGVIAFESNQVDLVSEFSGSGRIVQSDRTSQRRTLRFMEREAMLKRWNRILCRKFSGDGSVMKTESRFAIGQFIPRELQEKLAQLEFDHLEKFNIPLEEVAQTVFTIEKSANKFEFRIKEVTTLSDTK